MTFLLTLISCIVVAGLIALGVLVLGICIFSKATEFVYDDEEE